MRAAESNQRFFLRRVTDGYEPGHEPSYTSCYTPVDSSNAPSSLYPYTSYNRSKLSQIPEHLASSWSRSN